ncbi:MAG: hypothetical protein FD126_3170 [Elusimicrobia bacterium]|nr:MAG: hypothetical protein FD126_3170 [Elusimicrobiota bacterium]
MRAAVLAFLAFLPAAAPAAPPEYPPVQRSLESLKLGDKLEHVKIVYPPVPNKEWSKSREPFGGVERVHIQGGQAKHLPEAVEHLILGFKRGRLVTLEVRYAREFSKKKPLERLVSDLSLEYGEPRRQGESYFWWDESTVLVASQVLQPHPSGQGEELRSSLSVMDRAYFKP